MPPSPSRSSPPPPSSALPPPAIRSLPEPPNSPLSSASPVRVSAKSDPQTLSMLVSVSFPLPVAVPAPRSPVTAAAGAARRPGGGPARGGADDVLETGEGVDALPARETAQQVHGHRAGRAGVVDGV